jgi:serine/threonine protein kinase/tetratricopeptide (TPR) repeat protein
MNTLGKYILKKSLGKGGMGEVFLAHDPALDRNVAIKIVHAHLAGDVTFAARFQREARILAQLQHPNIVTIYEFDLAHTPPYMVMPFIQGGSLKDYLQTLRAENRAMPLSQVEAILVKIAEGLDYAHAQHVVHRDIKPANILFSKGNTQQNKLDDDNQPMLTDFGIAKLVDDVTQTQQLSMPGNTLGTATYMSPEQAASDTVTPRSDLYALGVVLFEMLTGRPPYQSSSPTAVMMQHLGEPIPDPRTLNPHLPVGITQVISKALAKKPEDRFENARALAKALHVALTQADAPTVIEDKTAKSLQAFVEVKAPVGPESAPKPTIQPAPEAQKEPQKANAQTRDRWISISNKVAEVIGQNKTATALGTVGIIVAALEFINRVLGLIDKLSSSLAIWLPYLGVPLLIAGFISAIVVARRNPLAWRRAYSIAAVIACVGIAWSVWSMYDRFRIRENFAVAIAQFDRKQTREFVDVSNRLLAAMQRDAEDAGGAISIERINETYTDRNAAKAGAAQRKINWMVWGQYDDKGVIFNVDALAPKVLTIEALSVNVFGAQRNPQVINTGATVSANPAMLRIERTLGDLREVSLIAKGSPEQINYFGNVVLGLAFLGNDDVQRAAKVLSNAIQKSESASRVGAGNEVEGRDIAYYYRGLINIQQGQMENAVKDLETALTLKPDSADIRYAVALAYSQNCSANVRTKRAITEVTEALRLDPTSIKANLLLGDLYLDDGDLTKSLEAYLKAEALASVPSQNAQSYRVSVYDRLYTVYTRLNRANDAQTALNKAVALRKESAIASEQTGNVLQSRVTNAYALLNESQFDAAVIAFNRALEISPTHALTLRGLATTLMYQSKYDEAETILNNALQNNDKDAMAYKLLGIVHYSNKKTNESVQALQKATDLNACDPNGLSLLGSAYYVQKNHIASARAHQKAAEIQGNDWLMWQSAGGSWMAACVDTTKPCAELEQAIKAFSRAMALAPTEFAPAFSLGFANELQGKWAEMAVNYEQALDKTTDPAYKEQILRGLGFAYLQQNKSDKAAQMYRDALGIKETPDARRGLLQAYFAQNKWDETIAEANRLIGVDPNDAVAKLGLRSAYWQRGNVFLRQLRLDNATTDFQASLGIQPTAEAYFGAALANYLRCIPDKAKAMAQNASTLEPAYLPLFALTLAANGQTIEHDKLQNGFGASATSKINEHLSYAEFLYLKGDLDKAVGEILQTLSEVKQIGDLARANVLLGRIYLLKGNVAASQQALEQVINAIPDHAYAQLYLGDVALVQGKPNDALTAFDRAQTKLVAYAGQDWLNAAILDIELPLHRSIAFKRLGRVGEAQRALDDARARADRLLKLAENMPQGLFISGIIWQELGDINKADIAFAQALRCDQSMGIFRKRSDEYLARLR